MVGRNKVSEEIFVFGVSEMAKKNTKKITKKKLVKPKAIKKKEKKKKNVCEFC